MIMVMMTMMMSMIIEAMIVMIRTLMRIGIMLIRI